LCVFEKNKGFRPFLSKVANRNSIQPKQLLYFIDDRCTGLLAAAPEARLCNQMKSNAQSHSNLKFSF
jgi:hypothetical protein